MFIKELVGQAGFSPTTPLTEAQLEQVLAHVNLELKSSEREVEEKNRNLHQLYSFDRFG